MGLYCVSICVHCTPVSCLVCIIVSVSHFYMSILVNQLAVQSILGTIKVLNLFIVHHYYCCLLLLSLLWQCQLQHFLVILVFSPISLSSFCLVLFGIYLFLWNIVCIQHFLNCLCLWCVYRNLFVLCVFQIVIWVDPVDGTAEYTQGSNDQSNNRFSFL